MTYFVRRKLASITASMHVRAGYTMQALRATTENIYSLERIISTALPLATAQLETFQDTVGEPMPPHLRAAVTTEISMWEALQESLALYRDSDPSDADARVYAQNMRVYLGIQLDVLRMSEELVHSCLTDHYITMTRALRAAAKEVPL